MGNFLGIPGTDWLGAGVSLVNGYLDRKAQQQANEQNIAAQKWITNFQAQHDIDMFNMENAYNTPLEQLKRMTEAGINPASAFSNGSASPVAASGQSSVSGAMPAISPVPSFLGASIGTFANLTNIAKAIGETKKLGIDTKRLEQLLPLELEGAQYENDIKQWQVQVGNDLQGKKISAETDNLIQTTSNLMAEAALIIKRGVLLDDEHSLNILDKTIKDLQSNALRLSNDKATQELAWLPQFLASALENQKADTRSKQASAFESYASGNKSIAEIQTINMSREDILDGLYLGNKLKRQQLSLNVINTLFDGLKTVSGLRYNDAQISQIEKSIEMMDFDQQMRVAELIARNVEFDGNAKISSQIGNAILGKIATEFEGQIRLGGR